MKNEAIDLADGHSLHRLHWLAILGGWLLLSLITSVQWYSLSRPSGIGLGFLINLFWSAVIWMFWVLATPVIFWLGQYIPLQRRRLTRALLAHFIFAFVFGWLHLACWAAVAVFYDFVQTGVPGKFAEEFFRLSQFVLYVEVVLYWAILGASMARQAFRQARERELKAQALEAQLQQAQLLALKQQLHPHFLFNALNTIAMLARNGETQQVVRMIAELGEMLRWSLNENVAQEITLAVELESARRYLAIEQFRFPDRLQVEMSVPEDLLSAAVPNLILQPLIENAVRHGIAKSSSASLVRINAQRREKVLELCVEDDGEGFPAEWKPGVGLGNTRARLAQLYGEHAELNIIQNGTKGASVRLCLPYRPAV
ncbi:MAG: histidine kinase [Acidobacteriota bacterium]